MPNESSPIAAKAEELVARRAALQAEIDEIDSRLAKAAAFLGVTWMVPAPSKGTPVTVDGRRAGSMVEFILQAVHASGLSGLTRQEIKTKVLAHPEFGPKLRKNENGYYNAVKRALVREELVEREGRLFSPRAADGVSAPEATPGTTISLFDPSRRGGGHG